jgi:hypothetical protein
LTVGPDWGTINAKEKRNPSAEDGLRMRIREKNMKKILMVLLAGFLTASVAMAQGTPERGKALTYPQLASLLVKALGLAEYLPAAPTTQQLFDILMQNGIAPADGWTMDEEAAVSKGDLARVLVQSMQREDEVENPADPQSWLDALTAMGINLSAASEALGSVDALPEVVATDLGFSSTDPLLYDIRVDSAPVYQKLPAAAPVTVETVQAVISKVESSDRKKHHPVTPTPH